MRALLRPALLALLAGGVLSCGDPPTSPPEDDDDDVTDAPVPTPTPTPTPEPTPPTDTPPTDTSSTAGCETGEALCDGVCLDVSADDANCGGCGVVCTGAQHCAEGVCRSSAIEHVVLVVQENHTFDSYFANWCTAPAGSNPACTTGPACCEAGPATDPGTGARPRVLDDASNGGGVLGEDPTHGKECELSQIHGGAMDRFVAGSPVRVDPLCEEPCSRPENFAYAERDTVGAYWDLAAANALADRYFQPVAGATTANTLYFLTAHWLFDDSEFRPNSIGSAERDGSDARCVDPTGVCLDGGIRSWPGGDTLPDHLANAGLQMTGYIEGYQAAVDATREFLNGGTITGCANASRDCPFDGAGLYACVYEPADVPFEFFDTLRDNPRTVPGRPSPFVKDYREFARDLEAGTLPEVAYLHAYTFRNEHPKWSTITAGIRFVQDILEAVEASAYAENTLVLVVWDEGGGYFDHVDPVAAWPVAPDTDSAGQPVPHGTRVPLLAIGPFAAAGTVSHVVMDHSSIVKFLEYNFLPPSEWVGEADARVNNLGSLLDPTRTGIPIPR